MGHGRALVRRGLQSFLKAFHDLEVVGEAASGEEALQKIESWMPDVVVMDMLNPGGNLCAEKRDNLAG